jgi:hypothetical protein
MSGSALRCVGALLAVLVLSGCGSLNLGVSVPIGPHTGIGVSVGSDGRVGVGVSVGGGQVGVGTSGQLPRKESEEPPSK